MRTYPDGWKVDRGTSFGLNHPHRLDDHVLLNTDGEIVASKYMSMTSEVTWGWRNWRHYSPLGRAKTQMQLWAVGTATLLGANFATTQPTWLEWGLVPLCWIAGGMGGRKIGQYMNKKEDACGRNRRTEEDHRDTQADGSATASFTVASPGTEEGTGEDPVLIDTAQWRRCPGTAVAAGLPARSMGNSLAPRAVAAHGSEFGERGRAASPSGWGVVRRGRTRRASRRSGDTVAPGHRRGG
jgi:hypothetical protein